MTSNGPARAELHLHLEACLRPATARELAERSGLPLPKQAPYQDFAEFSPQYEAARDLVLDLSVLHRVAAELVADQDARGVTFSEVNLCPASYGGRIGADEELVDAVLDALPRDRCGLILGIQRAEGPQAGWRTASLAIRYAGRGVTGLGLVGPEPPGPAHWYADHFAAARDAGLMSVPHAGETSGAESVRATLDHLQPHRILHGVRAIEDPAVVADLADRRICLDVCPTSNVNVGVAPDYAAHPLAALVRAGVPVSLASDGTYLFDTDLDAEYRHAADDCGLTVAELESVAATSMEFSAHG
ncbi:adenosine deaminase family protein [Nakamurella lactea]|uniref:adenosine deaminase family protein n=1 Tax=Nakamurella lactea TaxID=459515 RepID=UPI00041130E3|nr:adenosine deaminase family protein [Nakamurella lactea]